jgi:hypothetical protein
MKLKENTVEYCEQCNEKETAIIEAFKQEAPLIKQVMCITHFRIRYWHIMSHLPDPGEMRRFFNM